MFDGHGPYGHMVARKVRDTLPFLLCSEWGVKSGVDQSNTSENGNTNGGSHVDDVLDDDLIEAMEAESNGKFPEIHLPLKRSMLKAFRSMDKELKLHPTIDCFCSGSTAVSLLMQVILLLSVFLLAITSSGIEAFEIAGCVADWKKIISLYVCYYPKDQKKNFFIFVDVKEGHSYFQYGLQYSEIHQSLLYRVFQGFFFFFLILDLTQNSLFKFVDKDY